MYCDLLVGVNSVFVQSSDLEFCGLLNLGGIYFIVMVLKVLSYECHRPRANLVQFGRQTEQGLGVPIHCAPVSGVVTQQQARSLHGPPSLPETGKLEKNGKPALCLGTFSCHLSHLQGKASACQVCFEDRRGGQPPAARGRLNF